MDTPLSWNDLLQLGESKIRESEAERISVESKIKKNNEEKIERFKAFAKSSIPAVLHPGFFFDRWENDPNRRFTAVATINVPDCAPVELYYYYDEHKTDDGYYISCPIREVTLVNFRPEFDDEVDNGKRWYIGKTRQFVHLSFYGTLEHDTTSYAVLMVNAKKLGNNYSEVNDEVERRNEEDLVEPKNKNAYVNKEPPLAATLAIATPGEKLLYALHDLIVEQIDLAEFGDK